MSEEQSAVPAERRQEVDAHRRELEECERGERECVLRKPVPSRDGRRRRRLVIVLGVAVVVIAALAVPVIMAVMRSASNAARAGIEKTTETMDAVRRMEGHLQRDEARELDGR